MGVLCKACCFPHWYFSCSRWLEGLAQGWSALSDWEMFGTASAHGFCSWVISVKMLQRMLFWAFTHHIIVGVFWVCTSLDSDFFICSQLKVQTLLDEIQSQSTNQVVVLSWMIEQTFSHLQQYGLSLNIHPGFIAGLSFEWFMVPLIASRPNLDYLQFQNLYMQMCICQNNLVKRL